ncbi:MAG: Ig-like domain-containing protein, partial [Bacteroidales bacterium]|nr:Ig-like domain-containing protein [Bacteroidales bacterium]
DELVVGEKYVLVSNGFALVRDGSAASAAAFDATAMTIAVPTDLQSNVEWTLGTNTDSNNRGNVYDFSNGGYFFGILMNTAQNPYTYSVALNTSKQVATNQTIQNHNVNVETGYVYYRGNSSSQYIYYDTEAQAWTNHAASNGTFDPAYGTKLYKLKDMRADQNPQFSAAAAEYDLYTNAWTVAVPTLSGAQGTVTYTSSDEAVAQVSSTGAITIMTTAKKGDTATITASTAGNDTYKPGEASYTITIVNSNPNVATYNKVTSADDLEVGAKYLIVFEGLSGDTDGDGDPKVFNPVLNDAGTQFAKATSSAMDVTITGGAIESSDVSDYEFTLESGYYLKADRAAKYIYPGTSGSSSVLLAESPASHALAITFNNGIAQISNGSGYNVRYIVWSTSSHYFSCNQQVSGSYSTGICLYKLDDGRQAQEIAFGAADAEYDLGTSTWTKAVPTLMGAQGTVTYTSSDETVATVANDGTVTPLKKGTTTITASAAGNETFKPGEASYELTVINSNVPKYVKAEAIEAGQSYLIVSNGYLLRNESGTATPVAVEVNDGEILFDAASTDLWAATASGTSFNLTNSGQTLRRNSSNLQIGNASGTESNNQWTYDAANDHLMVSGNYYLYYSTGNSRFSISTTASSSHIAALYVLDDGRQAQEISFSAADAEYDLGTSTWTKATPALTGAKTTVTYASSDETVATVANDGTVTPLKVGTTTITATASADAQYKKATASYTLSVVNSAVVEKTYNRVSSITAGTYLIMGRETSSGRAGTYVCVFPPSEDNKCDHIKVSDNQELATLTTTSNEYGAYEVELIASGSNWLVKVKSSGLYMYYASSK